MIDLLQSLSASYILVLFAAFLFRVARYINTPEKISFSLEGFLFYFAVAAIIICAVTTFAVSA